MDLTYRIVRRLLRDDEVQFSRNRNFEAYEDRRVKRAMRLFRHLRSLEEDLLRLEGEKGVHLEAVEREGEAVTVRLVFDEREGRRISYLKEPEWRLLLENQRVSAILRELMANADRRTREVLEEELGLENDFSPMERSEDEGSEDEDGVH